jgi:hypothetical protein
MCQQQQRRKNNRTKATQNRHDSFRGFIVTMTTMTTMMMVMIHKNMEQCDMKKKTQRGRFPPALATISFFAWWGISAGKDGENKTSGGERYKQARTGRDRTGLMKSSYWGVEEVWYSADAISRVKMVVHQCLCRVVCGLFIYTEWLIR